MSNKKIRIAAIFLLCAMTLSVLVSCSGDKVPDGYQLVVREGDKFRLYVPTQWMPNTAGGITGATYSMNENVSIQVTVADDAGELSIAEYWTVCDEKNKAELENYEWTEKKPEETQLGGKYAEKYVYTATVTVRAGEEMSLSRIKYKFMQVMAKYDGDMYILLYSAPEDKYDDHITEIEGSADDAGVIGHFAFAAKYESEDNKKEYSDKVKAPEGMKLISTDERPYRFFVPKSWIVNNSTDATAAYASKDDSSNVSVQMYMSDNEKQTVEDYWKLCEEGYSSIFGESYRPVSSADDVEVNGLTGKKYVFTVKTGGEDYRIMQVIVQKGVMFYTITYTATEENFDKHMSEVSDMIKNFSVRKGST